MICARGKDPTHTNERLERKSERTLQVASSRGMRVFIYRGSFGAKILDKASRVPESAEISRREFTAEWDGATYR